MQSSNDDVLIQRSNFKTIKLKYFELNQESVIFLFFISGLRRFGAAGNCIGITLLIFLREKKEDLLFFSYTAF